MPRGRNKGSLNRKPGIHGQSIDKVRNEDGTINRNRLSLTITFNDTNGNRFNQVFEVLSKKDGNGVYIPNQSEKVLISESPASSDESEASE